MLIFKKYIYKERWIDLVKIQSIWTIDLLESILLNDTKFYFINSKSFSKLVIVKVWSSDQHVKITRELTRTCQFLVPTPELLNQTLRGIQSSALAHFRLIHFCSHYSHSRSSLLSEVSSFQQIFINYFICLRHYSQNSLSVD